MCIHVNAYTFYNSIQIIFYRLTMYKNVTNRCTISFKCCVVKNICRNKVIKLTRKIYPVAMYKNLHAYNERENF